MTRRTALAVLLLGSVLYAAPRLSRIEPIERKEPVRMAVTTYTGGAGDGDWETAGNWDNGVPSTGDTVRISKNATVDLTTNLDRTGDDTNNGLNLAAFIIEKDSPVNIGASGSPLIMTVGDTTESYLRHEGTGQLYFQSDEGSAAPGNDSYYLIVNSPYPRAMILTGSAAVHGLHILAGEVIINDGNLAVTPIYVAPVSAANATITRLTVIDWLSGTVQNAGGVVDFSQGAGVDMPATVNQWAGTFDTGGANQSATTSVFYIYGGYLNFGADENGGGGGVYLVLGGGRCEFDNYTKAVFGSVFKWPRAEFDYDLWKNLITNDPTNYHWQTTSPIGYSVVGAAAVGTN